MLPHSSGFPPHATTPFCRRFCAVDSFGTVPDCLTSHEREQPSFIDSPWAFSKCDVSSWQVLVVWLILFAAEAKPVQSFSPQM